jgi:hypothetical protein
MSDAAGDRLPRLPGAGALAWDVQKWMRAHARKGTRTCSVKGVVGARFTRVRTAVRSAPPAVDRACFNMIVCVRQKHLRQRASCVCDGPGQV